MDRARGARGTRVIVRDIDVARALEVVEVALGVSGVRHVGVDLSITVDAGRVVVGVVDADVVLATVDGARVELVRVGARAVVKRVALVERVWTLGRLVGDGVCVRRGRGFDRVGVTRTLSMHVVFRVVLAAWAALRAVLFGRRVKVDGRQEGVRVARATRKWIVREKLPYESVYVMARNRCESVRTY